MINKHLFEYSVVGEGRDRLDQRNSVRPEPFGFAGVTADAKLLNERLAGMKLGEKEGSKRVIMLESTQGTPYENYFQVLAAISANQGVVAIVEDDK